MADTGGQRQTAPDANGGRRMPTDASGCQRMHSAEIGQMFRSNTTGTEDRRRRGY
ncbi:MAG: hypothetical protein K6E86_09120 [Bacteroidales bacterium]|nr:hypothetical protein [Bacteroidales bacterium]